MPSIMRRERGGSILRTRIGYFEIFKEKHFAREEDDLDRLYSGNVGFSYVRFLFFFKLD